MLKQAHWLGLRTERLVLSITFVAPADAYYSMYSLCISHWQLLKALGLFGQRLSSSNQATFA